MDEEALILVAAAVLAYGLLSRRLQGGLLTLPLLFVAFGWAVGDGGLGLAALHPEHGVIHLVAEATLILVLFTDASRIDLGRLVADHTLPMRMLLFGLPLTVAAGTAAALLIFPHFSLAEAALLAAVLAPTDAALGQAVVSSKAVPVRIRQSLNVESGLNDGLALPLVLVCALWVGGAAAEQAAGVSSSADLAWFALAQVTLGPAVGGLVGWAGALLIDAATARGWMTAGFQGLASLAIAVLAFALAEQVGGNGFIAAFAAGLAFGHAVKVRGNFIYELMESEGQFLTLLTFLVFGAAMLPEGLAGLSWDMLLYALLSLTVLRMLPVALSLVGSGVSFATIGFLGWFGPRGLASILFALLIVERYDLVRAKELLAITIVTVGLSVLLHGVTAAPLARAYGRLMQGRLDADRGPGPEHRPVSEMRVRHRYGNGEHRG
ncbi:cation:proton antiporter [Marinibaculum pumilum]|uniref:Cation:proton antiporter n=1 Tax=Marinibaculum pumilum TaxID=1766165 RepID=A0ABV7L8M3_9PROT